MKAEELITFVDVTDELIREKKQFLFDSINEKIDNYQHIFRLSDKDINAVREYFKQYKSNESIMLYKHIKELSKENSIFKKIWVAKDDEYIVEPTDIPVAFFQAIITSLN